MKIRGKNVNTGEWYDWHEVQLDIPSFYKSYSDLSSLASALGGVVIGMSSDGVTLSSLTTAGKYFINKNNTLPSDIPSGLNVSFHLDVSSTIGGRLIQTCTNAITGDSYIRVRTNTGEFSAWKTLTN